MYPQGPPAPAHNGKGPGAALSRGGELYQAECETCHGAAGASDPDNFSPRPSGQHYAYLLR